MRPDLTPDARAAYEAAGFSRRDFLKRSGALVVAFSAADRLGLPGSPGTVAAQGINGRSTQALDGWISVMADGSVTAYTGKCELGQGLFTSQVQLIAEELVVPMSRVRLVQCDTSLTPDQGTTSGAQSHPANFNHANLALAGATAREALVRMAAERLGVPAEQLAVGDGAVFVRATPGQRVGYGDLVGGRRFGINLESHGEAPQAERVDGARQAGAARRHAGDGHRRARVRASRARARDGPRPRRAAAGGRRDARAGG